LKEKDSLLSTIKPEREESLDEKETRLENSWADRKKNEMAEVRAKDELKRTLHKWSIKKQRVFEMRTAMND
jgi:hypothetical protein